MESKFTLPLSGLKAIINMVDGKDASLAQLFDI